MQFKHFVALNVLDVMTTYIALSYFVSIGELNGVYASLYDKYGIIVGLMIVKTIGLTLMYGLIKIMPVMSNLKLLKREYKYNPKTLSTNTICVMMLAVVLNNLYWITKNIIV